MSTSGDIMSTLGGYHEYIGGCSVHWRDIMIHVGEQLHKILSISIENSDVLNIPLCTHDIPPDVLMIFPRCTHGSPDVLMASPTCIMISPSVLNIPRCTHDIPPMYSWYPLDVLNTPPMYSWIPLMYSWIPLMYSWIPPMY